MSRIELGEKALVVAMGHARTLGVVPGLEGPGAVLGAGAVMTPYGVIKHCRSRLIDRAPTDLRLDSGPSIYKDDWQTPNPVVMVSALKAIIHEGATVDQAMKHAGLPE